MTIDRELKHGYLAVNFEFRACLAGRCLCSQNINKYSNKPAKWLGFISRSNMYMYEPTISLVIGIDNSETRQK